jgi:hypothetical protein
MKRGICGWNIQHVGRDKNKYRALDERPEGKNTFGRPMC